LQVPLSPPQLSPWLRPTGSHLLSAAALHTWPAGQVTALHFQAVASEQTLHPAVQDESQQRPSIHAPDLQSPLATHMPPAS